MKQLHFYEIDALHNKLYIKDWVNWTGEVPQKDDFVLLHFGDNNEEEEKYHVVGRCIDVTRPDDVTIFVKPARTLF